MTTKSKYLISVEACLKWIESQMLTFNHGSRGVYERIRINENIRVNWVRPDCNTEIARVLTLYHQITGSDQYEYLYVNIIEWLLKVQDNDALSAWYGSFPFYLVDGHMEDSTNSKAVFQNDNGKVLLGLLELYQLRNDKRLLESAIKLADYWVSIQRPEGYFFRKDGRTQLYPEGPCFVEWLSVALIVLFKLTGNKKYEEAAMKGFQYLLGLQLESGRLKTTYDIVKTEDWRPVSSESVIALYAFSVAYQLTSDCVFLDALNKVGDYVISLQHVKGGIVNNDLESMDSSLQNNMDLCDLVYTQGYALMALNKAYKITGDKKYLNASHQLAHFLVDIQCKNESELWDGAWRGSFNIKTWEWDGRANQNNFADEGGLYSIYTGWCATTIMNGLLQLLAEESY